MARFEGGSLLLEERERVVFPVQSDHPLAHVQQLLEVRSVEEIKDFEFVKEWRSITTGEQSSLHLFRAGRVSEAELLTAVRQRGRVLQLTLADFVIPAGSTVVLQNTLNRIVANKVIVQGRLEFQGDLAISCDEIRGI
jgi:hypothetical protein